MVYLLLVLEVLLSMSADFFSMSSITFRLSPEARVFSSKLGLDVGFSIRLDIEVIIKDDSFELSEPNDDDGGTAVFGIIILLFSSWMGFGVVISLCLCDIHFKIESGMTDETSCKY